MTAIVKRPSESYEQSKEKLRDLEARLAEIDKRTDLKLDLFPVDASPGLCLLMKG